MKHKQKACLLFEPFWSSWFFCLEGRHVDCEMVFITCHISQYSMDLLSFHCWYCIVHCAYTFVRCLNMMADFSYIISACKCV